MMSKKKWVAAAVLSVMSTGAFADATYEFDSITHLKSDASTVTGVLVNGTAPTTLTLASTYGGTTCFNWLELMMKQPGTFTLTLNVSTSNAGQPPYDYIASCSLTAKP